MKAIVSICRKAAMSAAVLGLMAAPAAAANWMPDNGGQGHGHVMFNHNMSNHHSFNHHSFNHHMYNHNMSGHMAFNNGVRFDHDNGSYFMHGHRVYHHWHRGYRHYGDWWVPPALFGFFAGSAIATEPYYSYGYGNAHVRWCEEHYRSYDPGTDTFQPYVGPRKRCVSPYD